MQTSREFSNLLNELLLVHISPNSKQQIKRTRKLYLDIKNQQYTFTQDDLENGLKDNV